MKKEYAIINHNIEEAPYRNEDVFFESQNPNEILVKLIELEQGGNDLEDYSIEEYTVDEDGEFYEGSDFDTAENFHVRFGK